MKRLLIVLLGLFSIAHAQVFTPQNSAGTQFKRIKADSTIYIPTFCGVPTLRSATPQRQAALGFDTCNHLFYYYDPEPQTWTALSTGGGSTINIYNDTTIIICPVAGSCDTVYSTVIINDLTVSGDTAIIVCGTTGCDTIPINPGIYPVQIVFYGKNATNDSTILLLSNGTRFAASDNSPPCTVRNGVLTGGIVTWLHDYVYNISEAYYNIDCVTYHSLSTDITLDPADSSLDRIDLFNLTTSNTAIVVTGTPGSGIPPDYDPSLQLNISFALVTANTTEPVGVVNEWIYKENTEWTTAVGYPTIDPNSTNNPYAGSKDIEGTTVLSTHYITFTAPSGFNISNYDALTFQIRSKGNFGNNKKLVFRWFQAPSNATGSNVAVGSGSYGFVSTQTSSYQTITIPLADFNGPGIANANILRITQQNTNGSAGWYIDNIQLQKAGNAPPPNFTFDTTTIYQTIQNLYNYVTNDTSFSNRFFPYGDGVLTDTSYVRYDGDSLRIECHVYTNGTSVCDTQRIVTPTNINNFVDTTKDTLVVTPPSQILNGTDTIARIHHGPTSDIDTLIVQIPKSDPTHDGYMPKEAWTTLGGGNDSAYIDSYVTPDSLYQVFRRDNGDLDSFTYVSGHPFLTLTTTGTSGAATLDVPNQILNIPQYAAGISGIGNIGSGYRWVTSVGVNAKTAFAGNGVLIDSSSNTNGLTFKADTSIVATKNYVTNDRVNPIAGTNITITGTYPNLTFNASGGGSGGSGVNIYNADSSLSSNRTVNFNTKTLTLGGTGTITATGTMTSGLTINPSETRHANGDTLVGARFNSVFNNAGFRGGTSFGFYSDSDVVINNLRVGRGYYQVPTNLVIGNTGTGDSSKAAANIAIGHDAFRKNLLGTGNISIGQSANSNGTGGSDNIAIGRTAMGTGVVTGGQNTAVGGLTMQSLTSGARNTAFGYWALNVLAGSNDNSADGWAALTAVSSGARNSGFGSGAGSHVSTGSDNTHLGYNTGGNGTNTSFITAVGSMSLNGATGNGNTALGYYSGKYVTSQTNLVIIGSLDRASYVKEQTEQPFWFQQNATPKSQTGTLNGKMGIFNWSPTAYLDLPAGDSVTPPLRVRYTSLATTAATGDATTATITFAAQTIPPFIVGSYIHVTGVTPTGYNGTFAVTACTTTTVSYLNTTTGAQTVAGSVVQGQLLPTPVSGAIESDGTHLYWTDSTGTRKQLD